ncbi:methionine ABC transporter ATP-binding protein [Paenibacillus selenitireducens]|uniref:Methionine ABC transporter ATP-binding protein n=1 Tax=Paenibacillus selenitireducens TaxID=1324314 RepID=A0A1T2XK13_9BACL|nr:methionine ABC transporter ATP-binding protein [Paenibacillus selenitireducens]OPA80013.1 methionine ABC transporter ATP-binding protein [Paenibacillus selenitireducens]
MIRLNQLTKTYGNKHKQTTALQNLDLTITQGEIFGIIGHSGAGKSTLLRSINLLERPTSGEVWFGDTNITALSEKELQHVRRKMGMIFQHFNLLSSATVYDNIAFPLRLVRTPKEEIEQKVSNLLKLVGLEEHRNKYPAQLSGGQKQRVGIARALANDPQVLLCDEATSALDPQTTNSILRLLLDINKQLGITIVLITHEMHVIQTICDRVAVIHDGNIVEQGPVTEVFLKPEHRVTREFIREENENAELLDAIIESLPTNDHAQVVKINFLGTSTYEPILSVIVQTTGVSFAILQGTIATMKDTPYGQLIVRFEGSQEALERTYRMIESQVHELEVIR